MGKNKDAGQKPPGSRKPTGTWKNLEQVWIPKAPGKKGTPAYKTWAQEQFLILLEHGYNFTQAAERLGYTYRIQVGGRSCAKRTPSGRPRL